MNSILLIGIVSTVLVLLFIAIFLFKVWRKKVAHHQQFEHLLDDIKERQLARANKLVRRSSEKFNLDQSNAQSLSDQLVTAEKLFLKHFIDQQLQQHSIENFYEQLCELLDSYFSALSSQSNLANNTSSQVSILTKAEEDAMPEKQEQPIKQEEDWGDVFD